MKTDHKINLTKIEFDGVSYVSPSWNQMGEFTFHLSQDIIESGEKFDRVVALAKGGWTWARTLVDYIGVDEVSSLRIKSYTGVKESTEPQITQPLADPVLGQNVLLFDEVIDSGKTVRKACEYLKMMGVKKLTTACLCYKPRSIIKPDFYAFKTSAWVVFPHEIREFTELSAHRWRGLGVSENEIRKRLDALEIPDKQVRYFLDKIK